MDTEEMVQEVWDHQQIKQLKHQYSHHRQYHRWDEFVSLFAEGAVIEYPFKTIEGIEEIREFAEEEWTQNLENIFGMHGALMPNIDVSGDTAKADWFLLVYYALPDGPEGWAMGVYHDTYRCVGEEWKFSKIVAEVLYDTARSGRFFPEGYPTDPHVGKYPEYEG